ncbi:MAG: hypothetical protein JO093_15565 [Acidobacteria bacterium]|nr:hypothetical protein [Acidobacteriota bacterium]MBV9071520.1 hypothetical protein [Acidobacteriota bacterium]MBV9187033.1 hypothetical protein [Acidobacteriota bacterium]
MKISMRIAVTTLVFVICQPHTLLAQCPDWQANGTQSTTLTNCSLYISLNDSFGLQFKQANGTAGGVAGLDHNNALILKGTGGGLLIRDATNLNTRMTIQDTGNVGIGVALPQQLLHVGTGAIEIASGTANSDSYQNRATSIVFSRPDIPTTWLNRITNSWSGNNYDSTMNFEVNNGPSTYATPLTLTGNGRVGIGTPSPQYPLHVNGRIMSAVIPPNDTTEGIPGLMFASRGPVGGTYTWQLLSSSNYNNTSGISPNGVDLWEYPDSGTFGCCIPRITIKRASAASPQTLVIDGAGHVGIGMTPGNGYSLDVNGPIHATQVIGATYQDVAEWVPATAKMSPGTVVVVQRGAKNTVMPSSTEYATSVAGVVSEKPGLILGESSDSKAMIATTGRVKVHVDASSGAIEAGDLLVTSGKPGVAMKSQPVDLGGVKIHRPGTLIGKALESLPHGEGDILVLLSLQ